MSTKRAAEELEDSTTIVEKRAKLSKCDFVMQLPIELVEIVIREGNLSRKDVINLSEASSRHRAKLFPLVFERVKVTWGDFKQFKESFKSKELVEAARVYSELDDVKRTNYGEWNISLKELLEECPRLYDLTIEVMSSARCLKYQDSFDTELSDKVTSLRLISHASEAADESLFELTQLLKFHSVKRLVLNGFFVSKDQYFFPKFKPDLSDYKERIKDGRLVDLEQLELVDCRWEHPYNLSDVFAPNYPCPNPMVFNMTNKEYTAPSELALYYSEESSSFVVSERFRSLINNAEDEQFLFQTQFYGRLRDLKIVVLNRHGKEGFDYYYPWLAQLNLKRTFAAQNETTGELEKQSILTNLESMTLVGWRFATYREISTVFAVEEGLKLNMKHFTLYIVKNQGRDEQKEDEQLELARQRLERAFNGPGKNNHHCEIEVGFVDECLSDGRYDEIFSKYEEPASAP